LYENINTRISINLIWDSTNCLEVYRSNPKAFLHSTKYIWKQQRRTQKAIGYTRRGTFSEYCPYELNIFWILILTLHFKNNCFSKCHFQNFFIGVFNRLFPLWSKSFWHIIRFSSAAKFCHHYYYYFFLSQIDFYIRKNDRSGLHFNYFGNSHSSFSTKDL